MAAAEVQAATTQPGTAIAPAPVPSMTFEGMLATLSQADEMLLSDFDPAQVVGDLRDKVDAIDFVLKRLDALTSFFKGAAEPYLVKKRAAEAAQRRLRDYVARVMAEHGYDRVPGRACRAQLHDAQPSLEITAPPTAADYLERPELVEMVRSYEWKRDALKDALLDGRLPDCPFATIRHGKYVKFYPCAPEQLSGSKKRGTKK